MFKHVKWRRTDGYQGDSVWTHWDYDIQEPLSKFQWCKECVSTGKMKYLLFKMWSKPMEAFLVFLGVKRRHGLGMQHQAYMENHPKNLKRVYAWTYLCWRSLRIGLGLVSFDSLVNRLLLLLTSVATLFLVQMESKNDTRDFIDLKGINYLSAMIAWSLT